LARVIEETDRYVIVEVDERSDPGRGRAGSSTRSRGGTRGAASA